MKSYCKSWHRKKLRSFISNSWLAIMMIFLILIIINPQGKGYPYWEESQYSYTNQRGAQFLQIDACDLSQWNDTIGNSLSPEDWFDGAPNKTGNVAKRLYTSGFYYPIRTGQLFRSMFFRWFDVDYWTLHTLGYNSSYFDTRYEHWIWIWELDYSQWEFTSEQLDHEPDENYYRYVILDPLDYQYLLTNYDDFRQVFNDDPDVQALNYSLPLVSGDEFLFYLVLEDMIVASPVSGYLRDLIDVLDCQNVTLAGNTMELRFHGNEDYTLELKFNENGIVDRNVFKTAQGITFFKITSWYPMDFAPLILILSMVGLIALIGLQVYKWRKRVKFFKNN
ncbi:MAG: hypothetical protein EU531_04950 [Promethearchaeota archaeon]|nr:MAG: hypothetical protein EU531_04950 [Candidatus Lokiarchaeota archaeon]